MAKINLQDEESAVAAHASCVSSGASPLDFGQLYGRCLELDIWPTQKALANALGVTTTRVSRCLAATRLPPELLNALKDARSVSYRSLTRMIDVVNRTGETVARERAKHIRPHYTLRQIESVMLGTALSPPQAFEFRITPGPRNKYLRIETPHVREILAKLDQFQGMLLLFADFNLRK